MKDVVKRKPSLLIVIKTVQKKRYAGIVMSRVYERQTPQGHIKYPSVTTIIGEGTSNQGLIYWAANCVIEYIKMHLADIAKGLLTWEDIDLDKAKKYHEEVSKEARDIGSIVHDKIERNIKRGIALLEHSCDGHNSDDLTPLFLQTVLKERELAIQNAYYAFLQWRERVHFRPIASELIVYSHRYRYAGTLDCLAYINGKLYVIDFKTSKAHYNEASYQISGYRKATIEMIKLGNLNFPIPQGIGVLRLDKETGLPDWKDYSKNYRNHWQWFKLEIQQYYLAKKRRSGTLTVF